MAKALFTFEDCKVAFNLFCCVHGIDMLANFSRKTAYTSVCLVQSATRPVLIRAHRHRCSWS